MQIIKANESITVDHPVFLIFGQPGIGKTSLAYSAKETLLLDFDSGAHRAANRRDTLKIATWADVQELMEAAHALDPYRTIVVDTVGRLLDLMALDIIDQNPKYAQGAGALTQTGWGILKGRFRTWMTQLRAMGKDVLLIAHHREDKDGDVTQIRPDIVGGSYGEVLKTADFVGFLSMVGKNRVLDFNPTDRWVGKNPAQWRPIQIPPAEKAQTVIAGLFDQGRAALGKISESSAQVAQQVTDWRLKIDDFTTPDEVNRAIVDVNTLAPILQAQIKPTLKHKAEALGFTFDKANKQYVAPAPKPNGTEQSVTAAEIGW